MVLAQCLQRTIREQDLDWCDHWDWGQWMGRLFSEVGEKLGRWFSLD